MSNDFLSQEEIDALLNKNSDDEPEEETPSEAMAQLDSIQEDIIGEVGNISMSTAATTLSSILNHRVMITTPRVSVIPFRQIIDECSIPKVVANIKFKEGLEGNNFLMVDEKDAAIIADLMMGGDGTGANEELTELEISAVAEAMNQMIGSSSTSMATMLNRAIDIFPPDVSVWKDEESVDSTIAESNENICKIAFNLTVEGLIDSEIMQIYSMETVEKISKIMMGEEEEDTPIEEPILEEEVIQEETKVEEESQEVYQEEVLEESPRPAPKQRTVVQKPVFQDLNEDGESRKAPRNLDLIMDVPLEFSVVLGKNQKTIKEILSLNNGSVVELNKLADEPLEIYVNGKLIAEGEVVIINENFGVRITNILSKEQRLRNLN